MAAGKLTIFAIASGAAGVLFSAPILLESGFLGWIAEGLCAAGALAALAQLAAEALKDKKLLADLQEHEAALNPTAAATPPLSIDAATLAIVNSAEQAVSRAATKTADLEIRVRELELRLRVSDMSLKVAESALELTSNAAIDSAQENEMVLANAMMAHTHESEAAWKGRRDRELREMKTAFVSKVSHELRTPLASIKAYVEMLIDGEAEDSATQKQFYEIIQNEANRLGKLIDGTLKSPS